MMLRDLVAKDFSEYTKKTWGELYTVIHEQFPVREDLKQTHDYGVAQYWDKNPDHQVQALLAATKDKCEAAGVNWRVFDDGTAVDFLSERFGAEHARTFENCVHPCQRSDFLRYCILYHYGGIWLDADMTLAEVPAFLLAHDTPVFFMRTEFVKRITSWILYSPPRHDMFRELIETSIANINDEAFSKFHLETGAIQIINGVLHFNLIAARRVYDYLTEGRVGAPPFLLFDETVHDRYVIKGHDFFGARLDYKKTNLSWIKWRRKKMRAKGLI